MHGPDVSALQRAINARDRTPNVDVDGTYGPATSNAAKATARALGAAEATIAEGSTVGIQRIILDPDSRTEDQLSRARDRAAAAEKREHTLGTGPAAATKWARAQVGTVEHPAGSNTGPLIREWQKGAGMGAGPWCGAFVHEAVEHGGLTITGEVRYVPSAAAHARAGTGGLARWIPASDYRSARPGDLPCFDFGGNVLAHIGLLVAVNADDTISTVEGNTSSGDAGSQDNGGGVFARRRAVSLVAGFARPRWT